MMAEENKNPKNNAQDTLNVTAANNAQGNLKVGALSGTQTVENWKDAVYQGKTLTVEQQKAKETYDKKIAEMHNVNGDRKREKRELSHDKFKDEDVVKYMYEDWFLGALSWICNKIEDKTLALIDLAGNKWLERREKRMAETKALKDEKLKEAREKLETFNHNARGQTESKGGRPTDLEEVVAFHTSRYQNVFEALEKKLNGKPYDETVLHADEPWVKDLEAHPEKAAEFLAKAPQELENRVKMVEGITKLSATITALEMSDEMMRHDKKWRGEDGKYRSDEDLQAEFINRSVSRFEKIKEAVDSIDQDPSHQTAEQRNAAVNEFLQNLAEKAEKLQKKQLDNVDQNRFDAINNAPDKDVAKGIQKIDEIIAKRAASVSSSQKQTETQDLREATQTSTRENDARRMSADLDAQGRSLSARRVDNEARMATLNKWKENHFRGVTIDVAALHRQKGGEGR